MKPTLYAVFLYGVNIPAGVWRTAEAVESALAQLAPAITFAGVVGRPDSLLIRSSGATEESLRRGVAEAVGCKCAVALSQDTLVRITNAALATLRAAGDACEAPYRITADSVECEWCLVLSSDQLPSDATGPAWLFSPTGNAVAVAVLERRALLAMKRRRTPNGARVMLGAALNDPWDRALGRNGLTVACLTSRTLNRVVDVVEAAASLTGPAPLVSGDRVEE